jgi:hypothetical protein
LNQPHGPIRPILDLTQPLATLTLQQLIVNGRELDAHEIPRIRSSDSGTRQYQSPFYHSSTHEMVNHHHAPIHHRHDRTGHESDGLQRRYVSLQVPDLSAVHERLSVLERGLGNAFDQRCVNTNKQILLNYD